jgi:magnesium-transporting ATPase (P-type)
MTTNTIQRAAPLSQNQRRWQDLQGWRLCLGFVLGPIACALLTFLIEMFDSGVTGDDVITMIIALVFFGVSWQMVAGWVYLLLVVRARGRIGRNECLLLGIALMLLLPALFFLVILAGSGHASLAEVAVGFTPPWILISLGVFLVFGLISGGLLWQVGVRPAQAPVAASASIFE